MCIIEAKDLIIIILEDKFVLNIIANYDINSNKELVSWINEEHKPLLKQHFHFHFIETKYRPHLIFKIRSFTIVRNRLGLSLAEHDYIR